MRFNYQYRTSDNVLRSGTISAADREAVYIKLKSKGINPSRVEDAPGVFNKLLGRGKRWTAIAVLLCVSIVLLFQLSRTRKEIAAVHAYASVAPRHFIRFSEPPDLIRLFATDGERYLAGYAIPGAEPPAWRIDSETLEGCLGNRIHLSDGDTPEEQQLKQIVEGMKAELRQTIATAIGTCESYIIRLEERQAMEANYRRQTLQKFSAGLLSSEEAEAILSAMGLEPLE